MKLAEDLKKAVLQAAMQGKLTKQLETDSNVDELLKKIADEKDRRIKNEGLKREKALPQITSDELPFDLPEGWKAIYINDFAFVTKLAGFEYSAYIAPNLKTSGIPLFKGKNVQHGQLVLDFESYIPENISNNLSRSQLLRKCLLTPYVGTIGNIAIFDGSFKAHLGSNVGKIEIFNSDTEKFILEEYLLYYLRSDFGYKELIKYKKATAQESISIDAIRNVIVPIPSIEEQQRIVEKLNQILPLIDEYGKEEDELIALCQKFPEEMKKSVLKAAMQGKLTGQLKTDSSVDELLKKIADEKATLIAEGKIKKEKPLAEITEDEIPFDIPETWRWERIGNVFIHAAGKALNQLKEKEGKLLPYITTSNLYWDCFKLDDLKQMYFTDSELEKCTAKKGDLLVCEGGDVGRSAIWDKDYNICLQNHIHKLRPYSVEINVRLYFYYLMLLKLTGEVKGKGIGLKGLSAGALNTMIIPLPPIEEQQRIVEKLNSILPIIDSMSVYGTKKKAGRPKQEEALAFITSLLGTNKSTDSKSVTPEILELTSKAKEELPAIVKKYADLMGVTYNRITIRHQKTRWGSCTKTGNLSFNCLILKMPETVRDYVIVHELAHRKELNHSTKFWTIVSEYCPWYKDSKHWLKENGSSLLS